MKKLGVLFIVLTIVSGIFPLAHASSLTKAERYDAALSELQNYFNNENKMPLNEIVMRFDDLGLYKMSIELTYYTTILMSIEESDFGVVYMLLDLLDKSPEFNQFLQDEINLASLESLEWYTRGREAELNGKTDQAIDYYSNCISCLDSLKRCEELKTGTLDLLYMEALSYYNEHTYEGYQKACELFLNLGDYKESKAFLKKAEVFLEVFKPTPTPTTIPISTSAPTATPVPQKTWGEWSNWSTVKVTADSSTQVEQKTQYRSKNISSKQEYGNWSDWSDWSTKVVPENSTTDVETRTQYRYRDTTYTTEYSWSSWSSWSTNAVSASDTRDVETKKDQVTTTTKVYNYSRWKYYNTSYNTYYYSYSEYTGSSYKENSGKWEYKTTTTPLRKIGSEGGGKYEGYWYNQSESTKNTIQEVTLYRYRTQIEKQVPVVGTWSGWTTNYINSSSTREVQSRIQYRSRTRVLNTITIEGDWSAWSDNKVTENSSQKVETRIVYRYRNLN